MGFVLRFSEKITMLISWLASLEVQEDSKDLKDVQSRFPLAANDHEKLILLTYLLLVDTVKKFKSMSFQGCEALTVKSLPGFHHNTVDFTFTLSLLVVVVVARQCACSSVHVCDFRQPLVVHSSVMLSKKMEC